MKVPVIVHIVYSGPGGTSDYVFNLIRGDKDHEFHHAIVFFGVEQCPDSLFQTARTVTDKLEIIQKAPGFDADAYARLKGFLRSACANGVTLHVNSLIQPLSSRIPEGAKLIYVEHQANHLKSRKEILWSVLAQRKADVVVSLTESYQEELKRKLRFLFKPAKNFIIPTGIDLDFYRTYRDYKGSSKIGMVSRINSLRDHDTLLRAFMEIDHPTAELHIAGEGPLLDELRGRYNHPRIFFLGLLSAKEISDFLKSLDIYVHASLGETSSLALMQAQSAGLPIIASDVTGINNFLNVKNALLVPSKETEPLKNAIGILMDDISLRKKLGESSQDYANTNCDHIAMTKAYLKLFE